MHNVNHLPLAVYRSSVLVMSLEEDVESPLRMGGASYMVKKLQKRRAEGQSERNKQMAWSLLNRGHFALYSSRSLTAEASVLIDFAFEWGDLAIFQKVLEKSACGKYKPQLSLDVVRQACGVFAFDRIKHLFVHSVLISSPHSIARHLTRLAESRRSFVTNLAPWLQSSL